MAGAGFKTFGVGDVLTASDVNTYLMQQAVMNFADSGARGSAIGTATEGMVSYLQDTDAVEVYDGSAWVGVGLPLGTATPSEGDILTYGTATGSWNPTAFSETVLQVVTANTSTTTNNTTKSPVVTALTTSITPVSATSTIVVLAHADDIRGEVSGNIGTNWVLYKDGVSTGAGNSGSAATSDRYSTPGSVVYYETPGSTSSITYAMYVWNTNDTASIMRVAGYQSFVIWELEL